MSKNAQRYHSYYATGRHDKRTGQANRAWSIPVKYRRAYNHGFNSYNTPEPSPLSWGQRFLFWIGRKLGLDFQPYGVAA
ncbi:hypothetical protein [Pseudomonas phage Njord]|uniref:Uncharacterized protein n=1 Tax=Pseudomonas phage Njord TaxID=2163985 RepID=A0A2S1GMJ8_9CAUD|nr:hypothetical protein HOT08_gp23 [Pseudomonas phage Njord]AWD90611.1 hypothetical protein [Pseudomonas phage Njord]